MKTPELSVVILSYNTRRFLFRCLSSLKKVKSEVNFEVIVVDNASSDGSPEMVKKNFPDFRLVENEKNLGFAAGNNQTKRLVKGEYILFLNSDTLIKKGVLKKTLAMLKSQPDIGALTCKLVLPDGSLDKDTGRSFVTPWVGLVHLFLKLDRIFPHSKIFGRYWYGYIPEDVTHEVDAIQGAFFLTRKFVLDSVGWFDEDYFLDGEDIDLCWKIKKKGWRIIYYPEVSIIHFKGVSKGKLKKDSQVKFKDKLNFRMQGVNSMEIFYRKRLWSSYPLLINWLVILGIKLIKFWRFLTVIISELK